MKKKILCLHSGKREEPGACEIYRVTTPYYYMNGTLGWDAHYLSLSEYFDYYTLNGKTEAFFDATIAAYDLFVFARTYIKLNKRAFESAAWIIYKIRKAGKKVIYEVDDDYTNQFRYVADGDAVTFASWCDALTVTTPYLAKRMELLSKRPAYVIPNMLDPMFWRKPSLVELSKDKIRIGLTGSKTHTQDWKVLEGVLSKIAHDYPNVRVMLGGYHPDYLKDIPNVEFIPPIPYLKYTDLIKNCDIVLCPVDPDDQFNDGKSPIKYIEGAGATRMVNGYEAGAACIATNNKIYKLGIPSEKVGLLVDQTPEAWDTAIRKLITDEQYRKDMQINAYKHVWKNYDISKGWSEWARVYTKVLNKGSYQKADYGKHLRSSIGEPASVSDGVSQPV